MNERIKELARMSGFIIDKTESFSEFAEKTRLDCFAELIVRECSEHIRNRAMRAGGACTIVGEESLWLAKDLEEHFGVKE